MIKEVNNQTGGKKMSTKENEAYTAGVRDSMSGFTMAIDVCKAEAAKGDANCAAYVKGYEGSGVGE